MTNLEFIKKEIEKLEQCLMIVKANGALKYKLKYFKQIKTDLEAWEETKKYLTLNEGFVPFYESTYEYITLKNDCIDESNCEEEGISILKIKKALEVDDA